MNQLKHILPTIVACPLCHEKALAHGFCADCFADFDAQLMPPAVCPCCAEPSADGSVCGRCLNHPPQTDALWASFEYSEPLSTFLHHWKYRSLPQYSRCVQSIMLKCPPHFVTPIDFDWIIPVPLSRKRLLERGFHHTSELAKAAADYYHTPIMPINGIIREHRTAQTKLNREQRLHNLKHSFSVQLNVNNCNLLLIDDVVTTGATLDELARSLKEKGARQIYAWVLTHKRAKKI